MIKKSWFVFLAFFFCLFGNVSAEIQQVTITWTANLCRSECLRNLHDQLQNIPSVRDVRINEGAGKAFIFLKPNAPFSFAPFNQAMQLVGLSIVDIRVRAKGPIVNQGQDFILLSSGDNTPLTLINPVIPERNNYVVQYNAGAVNRRLSPTNIKKLEDARKSREIATIEGPLFLPERSPPLLLVIEQISFSAAK